MVPFGSSILTAKLWKGVKREYVLPSRSRVHKTRMRVGVKYFWNEVALCVPDKGGKRKTFAKNTIESPRSTALKRGKARHGNYRAKGESSSG